MTANDTPTSPSVRLGESLRDVFELVRRITKMLAEGHGVTLQQMIALYTIYEAKRCTMSELIGHIDVTSGAATGLVDRLAKQGLLAREPGTTDRRQVYLALTPAGIALVEAVNGEWEGILGRWQAAMPPEAGARVLDVLGALVIAGESLGLV